MAGSAAQARRILERKDLVDRLGFVVRKRLKLFFVDEVQLTSKEQRVLTWKAPLTVSDLERSVGAATGITLVAAFGVKGLVAFDLVAGSFNTDRYLAFLQKLKWAVGHKHVGLFFDGSSVHKSAAAQVAIEQHSWVRLLNVAYAQQDNPAKYLLNDVKHTFRKELLHAASLRSEGRTEGRRDAETIAAEVLGEVRQQECRQVILRCLGQMIAKYKIELGPHDLEAWFNAQ